jgi:hypothetical protein
MSANNVLRGINDALKDGQTIRDADSGAVISLSKTAVTLPQLTVTATTATAAAAAVTVTSKCVVITTEALTTAQNAFYTLVVTATGLVTASVPILCCVGNGTNTAGTPMVCSATRTDANTVTISVQNKHASAVALNGTLVISLWILG